MNAGPGMYRVRLSDGTLTYMLPPHQSARCIAPIAMKSMYVRLDHCASIRRAKLATGRGGRVPRSAPCRQLVRCDGGETTTSSTSHLR
jgi:hypothetical protein